MIHVIPNREIDLHEESTTCICCPSVITDEAEIVVIHNELTKIENALVIAHTRLFLTGTMLGTKR